MSKVCKGDILLEAIAAMYIVVIVMMVSIKLCTITNRNMIQAKKKFDAEESINAVCSELKYNISFYELKKILEGNRILIKYDENFLDKLTQEGLLKLDRVDENCSRISIELQGEEDENLNLKIQLVNGEESIQENIVKGHWMDYV